MFSVSYANTFYHQLKIPVSLFKANFNLKSYVGDLASQQSVPRSLVFKFIYLQSVMLRIKYISPSMSARGIFHNINRKSNIFIGLLN